LKDEEFRKLLVEYAKEISDPENKKVNLSANAEWLYGSQTTTAPTLVLSIQT